jgi:phospholipase C
MEQATGPGIHGAYVAPFCDCRRNAVGDSPYWSDTVIFVTWDDWGGWYDHVAPVVYNSYEYGFSVPLIVVSPYAKRGYVSHVTHDLAVS